MRDGKLSEARLDDALTRVLRVRFRLGEFDPFDSVPYSHISPAVINSPEHRALALKVADESIVLLQNRGNLLPLDKGKIKRLAVVGPLADRLMMNNYNGKAPPSVTALQGIKDRVAPGTEVVYTMGGLAGGNPDARWKKESAEIAADPAAELAKAVTLARSADVAVVCLGTTAAIEQEARDRHTLGLTGNQEELVKAIMAANPRTIVVEMSAGPLTLPWLEQNVPAILQAWWPGEEGGHAIADVLFGDVNPAGRLPHTVYASEAQVPPLTEYDVTKGFTYMYLNGTPLYPFGHGLSYSKFNYDHLKVSSESIKNGDTVTVSVDVSNTGNRAGDEVVQLYVHQIKSGVKRPAEEYGT